MRFVCSNLTQSASTVRPFCAKLDNPPPSPNLLGGRVVFSSFLRGGEIIKFTQNIRGEDLSAVYIALCAPWAVPCLLNDEQPLLHNFKQSTETVEGWLLSWMEQCSQLQLSKKIAVSSCASSRLECQRVVCGDDDDVMNCFCDSSCLFQYLST